MDRLDILENQSVYILREAYNAFPELCMLWSIGKDSTVLLHLTRKAFFGCVPFPLVHIDTNYKIPEMISYRDKVAKELGLRLIKGENRDALSAKRTFPDGAVSRLECCRLLKTEPLLHILDGTWQRYKLDVNSGEYIIDQDNTPFQAAIVGVRSDEEGSRSKERYFSPRGGAKWDIESQPPEFWNQFKTDFPRGVNIRVHPLLDWTEIDVWEYIQREKIQVIPLYFDHGDGLRYRSIGCAPCTKPIRSTSSTPEEIIQELKSGKLANIAERSGREQDKEDHRGLESLRRKGYM